MRCAILLITPEVLTSLLQLPEGTEVVAVHQGDRRGAIELKIHGAGWEIPPGAVIPRAVGIARRELVLDNVSPPERISIDWGFPVAEPEPF